MIRTSQIEVETPGGNSMHSMTVAVQSAIQATACSAGIATIFVAHTTASVTIREFEPGLFEDVHDTLERIAPASSTSKHNRLNFDDNAHSHLRSTVIGPSLVVPFENGRLLLGTWQQIVLIDFDTHSRRRTVYIQVFGE